MNVNLEIIFLRFILWKLLLKTIQINNIDSLIPTVTLIGDRAMEQVTMDGWESWIELESKFSLSLSLTHALLLVTSPHPTIPLMWGHTMRAALYKLQARRQFSPEINHLAPWSLIFDPPDCEEYTIISATQLWSLVMAAAAD